MVSTQDHNISENKESIVDAHSAMVRVYVQLRVCAPASKNAIYSIILFSACMLIFQLQYE
jgi:hypothetical protein